LQRTALKLIGNYGARKIHRRGREKANCLAKEMTDHPGAVKKDPQTQPDH